jgi:hypothetical protein
MAGEHVLPVLPALAGLFPDGGLRRGTTVMVRGAGAATSLSLAVAAGTSQAGSWCAAVGWPALGLVAAAGLGVALERLALVPQPGTQWAAVTAALIDAVDLILLEPRGARPAEARRLTARARERGVVLVLHAPRGSWPEAVDLSLTATPTLWQGLGQGYGYLQARSVTVSAIGRGAASRERRAQLWLPTGTGAVDGAPSAGAGTAGSTRGVTLDRDPAASASAAG